MKRTAKIALWITSISSRKINRENTLGDLEEFYDEIAEASGIKEANRWIWKQALKAIPAAFRSRFYWGGVMFKNNSKIVFRNMMNQKLFSAINILGLALGLAVCILSIVFVRYELSYDNYHKNAENIYRVTREFHTPNGYNPHFARVPDQWVNSLPDEFPEVTSLIRFQWTPSVNLKIGENKLRSFKWYVTDPEVFSVFSFKLLEGDSDTALKEPNSVVLTESVAARHFGSRDPMGQEIIVVDDNTGQNTIYRVTGVMKDLPANSHFQIDYLVSYPNEEARRNWAWVYILLKQGTDPIVLENKLPDFIKKYGGDTAAQYGSLHLQNLRDIHLYSHLDREIEPNGDIQNVYIFSLTALLVLLIASFNFMNLSTARSSKRAKEVGVRKILGAFRRQLINYFLWESIIYSLLALVIAVAIVVIVFPFYNNFLNNALTTEFIFNPLMMTAFLVIALLVGLFSGVYPSFVLSSFDPLRALFKGHSKIGSKFSFNLLLRKALVVLQFAISIVLIIFTIFSNNQFNYISNKKLGFNKDQVIAISNVTRNDHVKYTAFKNLLSGYSGIKGVTACMDVPSRDILDQGFSRVEGLHSGDESTILGLQSIDDNYIDLMGIDVIAGKGIDQKYDSELKRMQLPEMQEYVSAKEYEFVLNESAVKKLGWDSNAEAIGKKMNWQNNAFSLTGRVVGVVKDFNYASLKLNVRPLVLVNEPLWQLNYLIKLSAAGIRTTIAEIEKVWNQVHPDSPLVYDFLDDLFANLYKSEERQGDLLSAFSILAVFIAYLGLFGLVAFTTELRTKEIGIRKVLGGSISGVVILLSREFAKWITVAIVLAIPLGYYLVNGWLENFAYRIELSAWVFVLASLLSVLIAMVTISYQTIKAALANPIKSIRYE